MSYKALIVEHDPESIAVIEDVLTALGHEYHRAAGLVEARELLKPNGYDYVVLNGEIPARAGGKPRLQNAENFLDDCTAAKGKDRPPVIVLLALRPCAADLSLELVRLGSGLTKRGATEFIGTPLPPAGRTLDRVIKKVLAAKRERADTPFREPAPAEPPVTGPAVVGQAEPATPTPSGDAEIARENWLTVTQAAGLLVHDLPSLNIKKARSRISTAASRHEFKTTGERMNRRIEPNSFAAWRLKQRDRDLEAPASGGLEVPGIGRFESAVDWPA
jgi:CheY-like chemotaxis protein